MVKWLRHQLMSRQEISFGNKNVKVRVTDVKDTVKKEEAKEMFEYI